MFPLASIIINIIDIDRLDFLNGMEIPSHRGRKREGCDLRLSSPTIRNESVGFRVWSVASFLPEPQCCSDPGSPGHKAEEKGSV